MRRSEELDGVDGVGELLPPADAAFEEDAVLLNDDVWGVDAQAFAEAGGEVFAVGARVGEEDAVAGGGGHSK